jgi:hypothetical protein
VREERQLLMCGCQGLLAIGECTLCHCRASSSVSITSVTSLAFTGLMITWRPFRVTAPATPPPDPSHQQLEGCCDAFSLYFFWRELPGPSHCNGVRFVYTRDD